MIKLDEIVDFNHTICKDCMINYDNCWDIIPDIKNIIMRLIEDLDKDKYNILDNNVWISKSAVIDDSVNIIGPCIIDEGAVIRNSAYIRENVIIGKNSIIGNSTEIKNSIIFDECQLPHFNYVGDSIIGYKTHMGAGSIITNLKLNQSNITIKDINNIIDTGLIKMGAIIGNNVQIGANSVIYPGTIINSNTIIYPLAKVKGVIDTDDIRD